MESKVRAGTVTRCTGCGLLADYKYLDDQRRCPDCRPSLPDSGARREFSTGSVRDAEGGKGRWDLLPFEGLMRVARRFEAGGTKYGDRNWEKGQPVSVMADSAARHLFKFLAGQSDEDHLGAALWNLLCAATIEERCMAGTLPDELLDAGPNRKETS